MNLLPDGNKKNLVAEKKTKINTFFQKHWVTNIKKLVTSYLSP